MAEGNEPRPIDCYTKGDTYSTGSTFSCAGILTGSSKTLFFTIPLDKPLLGVTGVTLTNMMGSFRGVSGYVDGGDKYWQTTSSDYEIVISSINLNNISVRINYTNSLSTPTNTPANFTGTITMSFT